MQSAWLRDAATGVYLYEASVQFVRVPKADEYLWLDDAAYLVTAVSHSWDPQTGEPLVVLDIGATATAPLAGMKLKMVGTPKS